MDKVSHSDIKSYALNKWSSVTSMWGLPNPDISLIQFKWEGGNSEYGFSYRNTKTSQEQRFSWHFTLSLTGDVLWNPKFELQKSSSDNQQQTSGEIS